VQSGRATVTGVTAEAAEAANPRWRTLATISAYAVLSFVFGLAHLLRRAPFSGYDEAAHVDYAWKIAHGTLPFPGSLISPEILEMWSCVGQDNVSLPPCGSGAPASEFPAYGENYLQHPPLYYVLPAITGRLAMLFGSDFLIGARAAGIVWLLLGMVLVYVGLRTFKVRWEIAAPIGAIIPAVHLAMVASTTVNNDATAIAAGGAALALAGRVFARGRPGFILPFVVTALFALTKVLNAVPFLAVGLAVVIAAYAWPGRPAALTRLRAWLWFVAVVAGTAVVHVAWTVFRTLRRVPGWSSPVAGVNTDDIQGLPFDEWLTTLFSGIRSVTYGPEWITSINGADVAFAALLSPLLIAAPIVALLLWNRTDARWYLAVAAGLAMLGLPLIVQVQTFLSSGGSQYFQLISIRYSMPTLPLLLGCAALVLDSRRWVLATWITVGAGLLVGLGTILIG
jgi:hypothetical protein